MVDLNPVHKIKDGAHAFKDAVSKGKDAVEDAAADAYRGSNDAVRVFGRETGDTLKHSSGYLQDNPALFLPGGQIFFASNKTFDVLSAVTDDVPVVGGVTSFAASVSDFDKDIRNAFAKGAGNAVIDGTFDGVSFLGSLATEPLFGYELPDVNIVGNQDFSDASLAENIAFGTGYIGGTAAFFVVPGAGAPRAAILGARGARGAETITQVGRTGETLSTGAELVSTGERAVRLTKTADAIAGAESLASRGAMVLSDGRSVDAVTANLLRADGLTPESYVYRVAEPQFLDLANLSVRGNPKSSAMLRDPYNVVEYLPGSGVYVPKRLSARDAGPGLNVAVGDPSAYARPGNVLIGIKVDDILRAGGKFYRDEESALQGVRPLYATFDEELPFSIIRVFQ